LDVTLDNPDDIQEILWKFAEQRILTVAARTGILKHLGNGKDTVEKTAAALKLDSLAAGKIMRALSSMGILRSEGDTYFMDESLARHFREDNNDITAMILHSHHLYDIWGATLEKWLRGGELPPRQRSEEEIKAFGEAMRAMGSHVAEQVSRCLDLRNVKSLLDVGGGFGHFTRVLMKKNREITGTVLDTPETVKLARKSAGEEPSGEKIRWIEGDYHTADWGRNYDLVLLANILHQENEEKAKSLVTKGANALTHGGRLLVVDFSIDDEKRKSLIGALFAVNMRSFGDTYPESDLRKWMEDAGLVNIQRTDLSSFRWMITGFRIW
jgi:cyclopropane fatty-acyl-phospholipid synthase-like methyltransferase